MAKRSSKSTPEKPAAKKRVAKKPRATAGTAKKWREPFLKALSRRCSVAWAAQQAGVDRGYVYKLRGLDREFSDAWDAALDAGRELLEAEAHRRAHTVSDTLMIFLLKAHDPARYRETYRHEISGPGGAPIEIVAPDERDQRLAELIQKGLGDGGDDSDG